MDRAREAQPVRSCSTGGLDYAARHEKPNPFARVRLALPDEGGVGQLESPPMFFQSFGPTSARPPARVRLAPVFDWRPCSTGQPVRSCSSGAGSQDALHLALLALQGRIRAQLARRLKLKRIPTLQFVRDTLDDGEAELEARYELMEREEAAATGAAPGQRRRRRRRSSRAAAVAAAEADLDADDWRALDALVLPGRFEGLRG